MNYEEIGYQSYRRDDLGTELMANFVAEIIQETRIVDGMTTSSKLLIAGQYPKQKENTTDVPQPIDFPQVEIDADAFASLAWIMPNWGVKAVVRPGSGIKDDLRTFIQLRSNPKLKTIYRHTGWTVIDNKQVYLHAKGAIGKKGNDPNVSVRLPNELNKYDLTTDVQPAVALQATLDLANLAEPTITWPLIAATIAPLFGPVDFGIHVSGRTGTFKSEMISLFQSHYGEKMDARNLPGSWSSTGNALEAQAYLACNAPFVIDDFVPQGSAWQMRTYQQNADKIIRAQGNQAGRARLTDVSSLQNTMYPRGIIMSTGEDIPEGHSVRARLMIIELSPGDITTEKLSIAQANRSKYTASIVAIIQRIAENTDIKEMVQTRTQDLRDQYLNIGHSRTPQMLGKLVATIEAFLMVCKEHNVIDTKKQRTLRDIAKKAIEEAGQEQIKYLEETDPVDIFKQTIRNIFAGGLGHLKSMNGGIPGNATMVGWIEENGFDEMKTYKSRGPCIGYMNSREKEIDIDIAAGFNLIKKIAGAEMPLTKQTLMKRLKEAGILNRIDELRQRNTIRITADGHPRQVLAIGQEHILEEGESNEKE